MRPLLNASSTKHRILTLLKKSDPMTVAEMSSVIGISNMAVRQHLIALEEMGYLGHVVLRSGIGRPVYRYSLTREASGIFPDNYKGYLLDVLDSLSERHGRGMVDETLGMVGMKHFGRMQGLVGGYPDVRERAGALVDELNRMGFLAELRPGEGGSLELRKHNCLLEDVSSQYPEACTHEASTYRRLLGEGVERVAWRHAGSTACIYRIPLQ